VCRDDDDEDTMQVDWEWGTVRYKVSNYRKPPPAQQSSVPQRQAHAATSSSSQAAAVAASGRTDPVNGVTHANKPSKQTSQPVSDVFNIGNILVSEMYVRTYNKFFRFERNLIYR